MPDPDNKRPRRTLKNLPPDRFHPKALLVWLAFAAAAIALLKWSPGVTESPKLMQLQQVIDLTQHLAVKSGVIRYEPQNGPNYAEITGEVTDAALAANAGLMVNERGVKTNSFIAHGALTDTNLAILQKSEKFSEPPASTLFSQEVHSVVFCRYGAPLVSTTWFSESTS